MKKYKKAISYILAFILSLCTIAAIVLGYINSSFFNEINVRKAMRDTNYYYNIYSIIKETANDYVLQSGFDESVLENVITDIQVQSDMNRVVDCIYNNHKVEVDTEEIRKTLHENIQKQIQEQGHTVNESTQADIDEFENSIIDAYKSNMYYSEQTVNKMSNHIHKIRRSITTSVIILCIVIAILAFAIFKINEPALGVSLIITGTIFVVLKTYSVVNIAINNVLILNWAFSRTITFILNHLIQKIFTTGIIFIVIGVIAIVLSEFMKLRKDNF